MRIKNVEKWQKDIIDGLKYHYDVEHLAAVGKNTEFCDFAFEHKINHYEFVEDDYKCVGLYDVARIAKMYTHTKDVYIKICSDCVEFYEDNKTHYTYKGCEPYEWSANKISYIIGLVNTINKYLEA